MPSSASNIWVCQLLSRVLTLFDPMNWSPPVSSIHWIFQARILEWVAMPFSKGSSRPRDQTRISRIAGRLFTIWPNREAHLVFTWMYLNVEPTLLQIRLELFLSTNVIIHMPSFRLFCMSFLLLTHLYSIRRPTAVTILTTVKKGPLRNLTVYTCGYIL